MNRPGHDTDRDKHHCRAILEYFRQLPIGLPARQCPSTAELTQDGRFGLRPPNRINDLIHGKFDGHHYDFERMGFGRGEYRWRLHWPNRPGYPKPKNQTVLPLEPADGRLSQTRKASRRPGWKAQPIIPSSKVGKSWEDWCAERNRKMAEPQTVPDLVLTP